MNTSIFWKLSLGAVLIALPLAGGCDQESATSAPAITVAGTQDTTHNATAMTSAAPAEQGTTNALEPQLDDSPGKIVATPTVPPPSLHLSRPAIEVAKLAQAGLDESVMLAFVTNCPNTFNLNSDDLIYLNDIGVSGDVVTSMMEHDQVLKASLLNSALAAAPPAYTNEPAPAPETVEPPTPAEVVDNTQPVPENADYTYFYDSLAPYGTWVNIGGYGMCWRPTVAGLNAGWQPYCDHGHWVYSDCGWYWASDYSWGWAPFHYGRWFRHARWGWCWVPGSVWAPAWVTWRYTPEYCGWAPLPPAAVFTAGIGFTYYGSSVGFSFGFGLGLNCYSFVAYSHFCDPHWHRHRVSHRKASVFYPETRVATRFFMRGHRVINEGIPPSRVAAATHTPIPRLRIRDANSPMSARAGRIREAGRSLPVYRPTLTPNRRTTVAGTGGRLESRHVGNSVVRQMPMLAERSGITAVTPTSHDRRIETVPIYRNQAPRQAGTDTRVSTTRREVWAQPSAQRNAPLILRGPSLHGSSRATPSRNDTRITTSTPQPHAVTPTVQRRAPVQNNSRVIVIPDRRRSTWSAPQITTRGTVQAQSPQRSPNAFGHQQPRFQQRETRTFTPPSVLHRSQPQIRTFQRQQPTMPSQQPRWSAPTPTRSAPVFRSQPAAPRVQTHRAPAQRSYSPPPARRSPPSNNSSGGRGGGGGRRHR